MIFNVISQFLRDENDIMLHLLVHKTPFYQVVILEPHFLVDFMEFCLHTTHDSTYKYEKGLWGYSHATN